MNDNQKRVKKLVEDASSEYVKFDIQKVLRMEQQFNFATIFYPIVHSFSLLKDILQEGDYFDLVTNEEYQNINNYLPRMTQLLQRISSYDPEKAGNANEERQQLINEFNGYYENLKRFFVNVESYLGNNKNVVERTQFREKLSELNSISEKANNILESIQLAAEKVGTSKHAEIFNKQSQKHLVMAILFFLLSAAGTFGVGKFLFYVFEELVNSIKNTPNMNIAITLQIFFAKIIIVSYLSFVLYQLFKNYNAQMHLSTLNRHRANSLQTFKIFVDSTENPKTRDVILMQATRAIFEAGDTGFISQKDQAPVPGIELINSFPIETKK